MAGHPETDQAHQQPDERGDPPRHEQPRPHPALQRELTVGPRQGHGRDDPYGGEQAERPQPGQVRQELRRELQRVQLDLERGERTAKDHHDQEPEGGRRGDADRGDGSSVGPCREALPVGAAAGGEPREQHGDGQGALQHGEEEPVREPGRHQHQDRPGDGPAPAPRRDQDGERADLESEVQQVGDVLSHQPGCAERRSGQADRDGPRWAISTQGGEPERAHREGQERRKQLGEHDEQLKLAGSGDRSEQRRQHRVARAICGPERSDPVRRDEACPPHVPCRVESGRHPSVLQRIFEEIEQEDRQGERDGDPEHVRRTAAPALPRFGQRRGFEKPTRGHSVTLPACSPAFPLCAASSDAHAREGTSGSRSK